MRFLTIATVVIAALLGTIVVFTQRGEARRVESAGGCKNELLQLDIWKTQRVVSEVRADGDNMIVIVDKRAWLKTQRPSQVAIGKAVYCPIALSGKNGIVRVESANGEELGRVAAGKWTSELFPE